MTKRTQIKKAVKKEVARRQRSRQASRGRSSSRRRHVQPRVRRRQRNRIAKTSGLVGMVSPVILQKNKVDPRLPAESQFLASVLSPGYTEGPFVIDGKVRQDIFTSIGGSNYVQSVDLSLNPTSFYLIMFYPALGTTTLNNSGLWTGNIIPTGTINYGILATAVSYGAVWGNTVGFSDRFVVYASQAQITLRAPASTTSGSVWVGCFTRAQIAANGFTCDQLRQRGVEMSLKNTTSWSLRNVMMNRDLIDAAPGAVVGDGLYEEEMIHYALISPGAFQSITTGAVLPFVADIQIRANFAWVPDSTTTMMQGMVPSAPPAPPAPTPIEVQAQETLGESLRSPIPPPPGIALSVLADLNAPKVVRAPPVKKAAGSAIRAPTYGEAGWITETGLQAALARLTPMNPGTGDPLPEGMRNPYLEDIKVASMTPHAQLIRGTIENLPPDLTRLSSWLDWCSIKECNHFDYDQFPPEVSELMDEVADIRDQILEQLRKQENWRRHIHQVLLDAPQRTTHRHGRIEVEYQYEGVWMQPNTIVSMERNKFFPPEGSVKAVSFEGAS